jgi:hypothetical protein
MRPSARILVSALVATAALGPAAPASARVIDLGRTDDMPAPSCPGDPCQAVSRTTGYQAKAGTAANPFRAPANGRVVAWSIRLGDPSDAQREFFEERLGGTASAGITVLRPGPRLTGRVLARSPVKRLAPYFGRTVQFPLVRTLHVRRGHLLALTVPTWAPALALNLGNDTSWRAARSNRPRSRCLETGMQTAQQRIGALARFLCRYPTARLTYSVTMVTSPPRVRR